MIRYAVGESISVDQFIDVLRRSTLAERRPVDDRDCLAGMLRHADLLVTAWEQDLLVGVARSVTDFNYCCYLSDLAVDQAYQQTGIGRELIRRTREQLGSGCMVILLSAPAATGYYPRIGFRLHGSAWVLRPADELQ
ncbi:MAG TPA: GNAT family N-acetyltransferase [Anaerolineales bacterium]|nr:GNAT family N-acetyltransferase [Anaerolineales bacterium]